MVISGNAQAGISCSIARMRAESIYQERSIPQRDSPIRESGTPNLARKRSLQSADFIFQVLGLLAQRAFIRLRAHRLDRIANALDIVLQPIAHDREIRRKCTVVVNEENVSKAFCSVAPDVLSHDLATDRAPDVVYSMLLAYFFCVVQRYGTVAVGDNENMFLRKYLAATSIDANNF